MGGWGQLNAASRPRVGSAHLTPPGLRLGCLPPLSSAAGDSPGGLLGRSPQGRQGPSPSSPERGLPAPCPVSAAPGGGSSPWPSGLSQRRGLVFPTDGQAAGPAGAGAGLEARKSGTSLAESRALHLQVPGPPVVRQEGAAGDAAAPVLWAPRARCPPGGAGGVPGSAQVSCCGAGMGAPGHLSPSSVCAARDPPVPTAGAGGKSGEGLVPGPPFLPLPPSSSACPVPAGLCPRDTTRDRASLGAARRPSVPAGTGRHTRALGTAQEAHPGGEPRPAGTGAVWPLSPALLHPRSQETGCGGHTSAPGAGQEEDRALQVWVPKALRGWLSAPRGHTGGLAVLGGKGARAPPLCMAPGSPWEVLRGRPPWWLRGPQSLAPSLQGAGPPILEFLVPCGEWSALEDKGGRGGSTAQSPWEATFGAPMAQPASSFQA